MFPLQHHVSTLACLSLGLVYATTVPAARAQEACYAECADGLQGQDDRGPTVGSPAPAFEGHLLPAPENALATQGAQPTSLGELLRGRPVVLAFGSLT